MGTKSDLEIWRGASNRQLRAAREWVSKQLCIPYVQTTEQVSVAYVQRHFKKGRDTGWDGFIANLT